MSVSCSTSPTATSTNVFTTVTETTTTSLSVTTQPPETSLTFSLAPCPSSLSSGLVFSCPPATVSYTTTIPGATQTVQVPLTFTSTITSIDVVTLFGTSCTTIDTRVNSPTPVAQPTQDQAPSVTPSIGTPIFTPSAISTQPSSTESSVSTTVETVTSGTSSSQASSTIATDNQNKGNHDVAPIVGGTIGGFFGLIAIVAFIWFILRRRQRWDDIFEKEEDKIIVGGARGAHRPARFSLDLDPEPKPYQYGLVGRAVAPSAASPPHSPPMRPSRSPGPSDLNQARTSLMPLNPVAASTLTLSSMPSTGSSQSPLYPPQQGFTPKGYQQGYAPPLPQKQSMDWGTTTSTNPAHVKHSHSASTASYMSPPVSHAHWTGDVGPGYNGGVAMTMGINTPVMIPDEVMPMNRSGSPTSIQETRRLQVTNANPDEFEFGESSTSAAAAAAAAAMSAKDKKLRDGKGRLVTRSAGPPIVHVDGGRVVANVEPAASGPQPPAYTD